MSNRFHMPLRFLDLIRDELEKADAELDQMESEKDAEIRRALRYIVKLNRKEDPDKAIWKAQMKDRLSLFVSRGCGRMPR